MRVLVILVITRVVYSQDAHHVHQPHFVRAIVGDNFPIFFKPDPYHFGYGLNDGHGTDRHRQESGDEYGNKKGSYGYKDAHGIYRQVDYVADAYGFRAVVRTNEPGTANQDPAHAKILANPVMAISHNPYQGYGLGSHNLYETSSLAHTPPAIFASPVSHELHQPFVTAGLVGSPFSPFVGFASFH